MKTELIQATAHQIAMEMTKERIRQIFKTNFSSDKDSTEKATEYFMAQYATALNTFAQSDLMLEINSEDHTTAQQIAVEMTKKLIRNTFKTYVSPDMDSTKRATEYFITQYKVARNTLEQSDLMLDVKASEIYSEVVLNKRHQI